jgi:nicotinamide-nucleotide amidase
MPDVAVPMLAAEIIRLAAGRGLRISTVESCTGGLIGAALTAPPGASAVFDGGWLVYSNASKERLLGVPTELFITHGSVSAEAVAALAEAALERSGSDLVIAVSGIAGPGGGSDAKPVGLFHACIAARGREAIEHREVVADAATIGRVATRDAFVGIALRLIAHALAR